MSVDAVFTSATTAFVELVRMIPRSAWTGPGLGDWDLRALVGHTSRSLITVSQYLAALGERADVTGPADYYARIREIAAAMGTTDIVERGRQAGRDLGDDPAATVERLADRALADIAAVDDPVITVIGGLGIRLHAYLPTRTFELAVHGMDIVRATGLDVRLPDAVLESATLLAAEIAVAVGEGETVLTALTGRAALPPTFSVV